MKVYRIINKHWLNQEGKTQATKKITSVKANLRIQNKIISKQPQIHAHIKQMVKVILWISLIN